MIDMKNAIYILFLFALSCTPDSPAPVAYFADFTHNGTAYRYTTTPENMRTFVNPIHPNRVIHAVNFFDGDSLHLTTVLTMNLPDTATLQGVVDWLTGPVTWTLRPDVPEGMTYFAPFFHHADNGGFLEIDGTQQINAEVVAVVEPVAGCVDVEIGFPYLYARSGVPGCGPASVSCQNEFENGNLKTQICLEQ